MMQHDRLAHTIFNVFLIFLIIYIPKAHGEVIFRWTDDTGRICYSNISPSGGVKEYSADTVSHPMSRSTSPEQVTTGDSRTDKIPAKTDGVQSDRSAAFLKQRIMGQKRSIGYIEALLRKHPNDSVLRKSLSKRKRYLFEDLNRLKNDQQ